MQHIGGDVTKIECTKYIRLAHACKIRLESHISGAREEFATFQVHR